MRLPPPREPTFWLVVLLAAGAIYRLAFLLHGPDWVVSLCTADDYFYYLNTARNIALGHGSSCDGGITIHNGYHPLFLVLLLPGFALGASKMCMVYVGLGLLSVAGLAAAWLAWRCARRLGNRWLALCPAVALALNLYFVRTSLWGFETFLAIALSLALLDAILCGRASGVLGLWLGLAIMARVDAILLAPPLALYLSFARRWRDLVRSAAVALLVCAPWIGWSTATLHEVMPQSGAAKIMAGNPAGFWRGFEAFCAQLPTLLAADGMDKCVPHPALLALGVLALAAIMRDARRTGWISLAALSLAGVYALLTDTGLAWQFKRYTAPAAVLLGVVLFSLPRPPARVSSLAWLVPLLLAGVAVSLDTGYVRWALGTPPLRTYHGLCQREVPAVLQRIVGPGDRVGCFDSGSASYFSSVPVVNLDGLVNADIVRILRDRSPSAGTWRDRYLRYFRDKGITILVGGTRYSWATMFPDLSQWETLHPPLNSEDGGEIVFVRVPEQPPGTSQPAPTRTNR